MLNIKPVKDINCPELECARSIYHEAFPPQERREWNAVLDLIRNEPSYTFFVAEDEGETIGFITAWEFEEFIFAEHLATTSSSRNKGYGTKIFNALREALPKRLIFEVERPGDSPMAERRIGFYERLGMKIVETSYIQPSYFPTLDPVPMYLMSDSDGYRREWVTEIHTKAYNQKRRKQLDKNNMNHTYISENIKYIGVKDLDIDLFESQYLVPEGVTYNSYVILDEKTAVLDTVDPRRTGEWLANLETALGGRKPDYLIVHHLEPDHAGSIAVFAEKYPEAEIVLSKKAAGMIGQFFNELPASRLIPVSEGETLNLGSHTLTFVMAPMVHWPEVMVSYESSEKVLFAADGFGKFGATMDASDNWDDEARRYFINIVGKYGPQVQALLKKAATLDIKTICPLHGPILKENLGHYIEKYDIWSSYRPEEEGVLIAFASIHGNTAKAARYIAEVLKSRGVKTEVADLSRNDMHKAVADAYRFDKMILACASYDGGIFPPMEKFLNHLKAKNFQNRKVAIVENGSWAPCAGRIIRATLEGMKGITICDNMVSIRSCMKECDKGEINAMIDELLA